MKIKEIKALQALLIALAVCAGVSLSAVTPAIDVEMKSGKVLADGDLNFRGTLGESKEMPVGFQNIRLRFELDTNAGEEQLKTLYGLTARYCVVYQTLKSPPVLEIS